MSASSIVVRRPLIVKNESVADRPAKARNYQDLDVWKKGIEIVDLVYELTESLDSAERFGLCTQMRRAAVAIPSNSAEGFVRAHPKEYRQFCHVALGSCAELDTQAVIASRRQLVGATDVVALREALDHESRMLMNLIKRLRG